MAVILAVLVGLCLGSFLNVLLARLYRPGRIGKKGIVAGRSECFSCRHRLPWYDLIPLASWVALGGQCRFCHARIPMQYPVVEAAVAGIFGLFAYHSAVPTPESWFSFVFLFGFLALFFFDRQSFILPDVVMAPMIALALMFRGVSHPESLVPALVSGFLMAACFGILYAVSRGRWVGFGDVKLMALVGILFGYPTAWLVLVASVWLGAFWGLALIGMGRATRETALPFGSFVSCVAILAILFQHELQLFIQQFPAL